MKNLVLYIPFILVLGFASSCERYQIVTISSKMQKSNIQEHVFENDTMKVAYSFSGLNCPVFIKVFNKLQRPLYVDWSRSAAIIGEEKVSYWVNEATINATSNGTEFRVLDHTSVTSSQINGTIFKNDKISFIPPQSYITFVPVNLRASFFDLSGQHNKSKVVLQSQAGPFSATMYSFSVDSTQLKFRSFLTLSINGDISSPIYLENTFWVSDVIQTMIDPANLSNKYSDQFYVRKSTGFGVFMGCTFVSILVLGIAALNAK